MLIVSVVFRLRRRSDRLLTDVANPLADPGKRVHNHGTDSASRSPIRTNRRLGSFTKLEDTRFGRSRLAHHRRGGGRPAASAAL